MWNVFTLLNIMATNSATKRRICIKYLHQHSSVNSSVLNLFVCRFVTFMTLQCTNHCIKQSVQCTLNANVLQVCVDSFSKRCFTVALKEKPNWNTNLYACGIDRNGKKVLFSFASSSTLHPRQLLGRWVVVSYWQASLFFIRYTLH